MNYLKSILSIFKFHKFKIFIFFVLFLVFGLLQFPFNDVGDVATTKIYELSGGQVFLQFSDMSVSVIPQLGFRFDNVSVETQMFPPLKAETISMAPSLTGLLSFKPGVSVSADGIFKGGLDLSTRGDAKNAQNVLKQNISLELRQVDLEEVTRFLESPIDIGGKLSLETNQIIDPSFAEQPTGPFDLQIETAKLLPSNISTPIGPFSLPALNFQSLQAEGEMKDGTLRIKKGKLGTPQDELSGSIRGQIDLRFQPIGTRVQAVPGAYDLSIELEVKQALEDRLGTLWSLVEGFVEPYKRASPAGKKIFAFRISGQGLTTPAKLSAYQ